MEFNPFAGLPKPVVCQKRHVRLSPVAHCHKYDSCSSDGCRLWMDAQGSPFLPYDTGYAFLFFLIIWALEFYPLGKSADQVFWKHTKEVLDFHGCKDRTEEENQELIKKLAEDGGLSTANSLVILGLDLLLIFFCKQVTTAIFLYFSYTR